MKRYLLALLLLALPLAAQDAPPKPDDPAKITRRVDKLFMLKYADPGSLSNLLRIFGATIVPNPEMHALAVEATPESMTAIEDAIKRLDVPASAPRNLELTVYFVVGAEGETPYGGPLPKDLDPVISALKSTLPFKEYRLMDVMTIRTRTGQQVNMNSNAGSMKEDGRGQAQITTYFQINSSSINPDGVTVRLDRMRSTAKVPYATGGGWQNMDLSINEDMDVKEGQKAVVGRVGISRDQALFLVLSAKILQ
jgi:hypothetical protein